jgi:hypothetical protein
MDACWQAAACFHLDLPTFVVLTVILMFALTTQGLPPAALAALKDTAETLHNLMAQLVQVRTSAAIQVTSELQYMQA